MRKEAGQAFILVLIFLAVGALVITPSLNLGRTALMSRVIHGRLLMEQYTADAAIEDAMWRLLYEPGFAECVMNEDPGCTDPFTFNLNGTTAQIEILVDVPSGLSGVSLADKYMLKPTKTVCPNGVDDGPGDPCPETVDPGVPTTFTYTITMERLEPDDLVFQPVEKIRDGLDLGFTYVPNSSALDGVPFNDDDLTILKEPVKLTEVPVEREYDAVADAMVKEASPTTNYGTDANMDVQSEVSNNARVFVRFDLSEIPEISAGSTITKAELELCADTPVAGDTRTYDVHRVTASWDESTITWNNQPPVAGAPTASKKAPKDPGKCIKWDVKNDIQAWVDGTPNYGWRISDDAEDSATPYTTTFRTREDTTDPNKQPILKKVQYLPGYWKIEWIFLPLLDFPQYGDKRTLSFQAQTTGLDDGRYCNVAEVEHKDNAETAPTGMTAQVVVGTPPSPNCPGGGITVTKTIDPEMVIPEDPPVEVTFTYVISITNNDVGPFNKFDKIVDYLPPGFAYVPGSASASWSSLNSTDNPYYPYNICDFEPKETLQADGRWKLEWHKKNSVNGPGVDLCHDQPFPEAATYTQVFQATATLTESGVFNNEVFVKLKDFDRYGGDRGLKQGKEALSWPTGSAIVPAANMQAVTQGTTVSVNSLFIPSGMDINSWQQE